MLKLRPLNDFVVVKLDPPETKTKGNIYLPQKSTARETFRQEIRTATVVRVGPGRMSEDCTIRVPVSVKPGDRVVLGWITEDH